MCYYAILMSRELLLCLPCAMTVQGQEKEAKEKPPAGCTDLQGRHKDKTTITVIKGT